MKVTLQELRKIVKEEIATAIDEAAQHGSILSTGSVKPAQLAAAFGVDPSKMQDTMTRLKSAADKGDVEVQKLDANSRALLLQLGFNLVNSNRDQLGEIINVLRRAESGAH